MKGRSWLAVIVLLGAAPLLPPDPPGGKLLHLTGRADLAKAAVAAGAKGLVIAGTGAGHANNARKTLKDQQEMLEQARGLAKAEPGTRFVVEGFEAQAFVLRQTAVKLRQQGDEPFHQLAAQRRQLASFRDRRIRLFAHVNHAEAVYIIMDQGRGFDPSALPEPTDTTNLGKGSGRGVLLMRSFMDKVNYTPSGNQVTLIKRREKKDS